MDTFSPAGAWLETTDCVICCKPDCVEQRLPRLPLVLAEVTIELPGPGARLGVELGSCAFTSPRVMMPRRQRFFKVILQSLAS